MGKKARSDIFTSFLHAPLFEQALCVSDLEHLLSLAERRAQRRWPSVRVPTELFMSHLVQHLSSDEPLGEALARMRMSDLYLACACAHGNGEAIRQFEKHCFPQIDLAIERVGVPVDRDDFCDAVRERLFVAAPGNPSRIAQYAGRGDLPRWFGVVVVRMLLNWSVQAIRETELHTELLFQAPSADDAELKPFLESYRLEVEGALADAIKKLTTETRNLLRFALKELTFDQLARLYGTHRTTVSRRIAGAQSALFKHFRDCVAARLRLGSNEVDSLLRLLAGQIDGSLRRLLRTTEQN